MTFLQGPSGKTSAMRVGTLGVLASIWLTWAWVGASKLEVQPISPEMVVVTLGLMGVKVAQRSVEGKTAGPAAPPAGPWPQS